MPTHIRIEKLEKFATKLANQCEFLERTTRQMKKYEKNDGDNEMQVAFLESQKILTYNFLFDYCKEFDIELPVVLGMN